MELYTFQGNVLVKANKTDDLGKEVGFTITDAEYYARKTCNNCWGKGWNLVVVPTGQSFNQVCSCAVTRYNKQKTSN